MIKISPRALSPQQLIELPNYTKLLFIVKSNGYIRRCIKYNQFNPHGLLFNYHHEDITGGGSSGTFDLREGKIPDGYMVCIDPNPEIEANYSSGIGIK